MSSLSRRNFAAPLFLVFLMVAMSWSSVLDNRHDAQTETSLSDVVVSHVGWGSPTTIDSVGRVGEDPSLAIDSNDNLHVTYHNVTHGNLDYMIHDGSSWSTPVSLDSTGNVGRESSLAIDSNDDLHVTYLDLTNDNLKYGSDNSGGNDADNDGVSNEEDPCPYNYGTSTEDREGCIDTDGDGWSDLGDDFHNKATQWNDSDGDGLGDNWGNTSWNGTREAHWPGQWVANAYNPDANPYDFDNDGFEDESITGAEEGSVGFDDCPFIYGLSEEDRVGCIDSDGDGWSNTGDDFPGASTQWSDNDGDGYGDNSNGQFPDSCTSLAGDSWEDVFGCYDGDGDGWSNLSDVDDSDASESEDSDGDGYGDNEADVFPYDSTQWNDTDDDGYGDNASGNNPDAFPNNFDEWEDSDDDGYGDNNADDVGDSFPYDSTQWNDTDNDGYGDNASGNNPDAFPNNDEEWEDTDSDGFGDNNEDTCPYTAGANMTFGEFMGCPDTDGDGYADLEDAFDNDDSQWDDEDGDGYGDSATGTTPDSCSNEYGTSTKSADYNMSSNEYENGTSYGCPDSDSDGYDDYTDPCPYSYGNSWVDSFACPDSDQDGISDLSDPYPNIATSDIEDWDGDGYLDNAADDADNADAFDYDSTQWNDSDLDGYGDNPNGTYPDAFTNDNSQWADNDGDGYGDNEFGNNSDACIYSNGNSTTDRYGCADSDGDGYSNPDGDWAVYDGADAFITDKTQWSDYDEDGYGDNSGGSTPDYCVNSFGESTMSANYDSSDNTWSNVTKYGCYDGDGDGYDDNTDPCPYSYGNSWFDQLGCLDTDQDGISDSNDPYPNSATSDTEDWDGDGYLDHAADPADNVDAFDEDNSQWADNDDDGYGDNPNGTEADAFPSDSSQWADTDGDGYGDEYDGTNPDECIFSSGNSTEDRYGCTDSDGDGYSNPDGEWGIYDGADAFISEITQWEDVDGDGYGDNSDGLNPDSCNYNYGESTLYASYNGSTGEWSNVTEYGCPDEDGDGYSDYSDPCPYSFGNSWYDQLACPDSDQDGISNINDPYPNTATSNVEDWDDDGYTDHAFNQTLNVDIFDYDGTQWADSDGDSYGDNPNGTNPDMFPNDASQWQDSDGDGFGDDSNGLQGDYCPFTLGNSTMPYFGCEDSDGDQWADNYDDFESDPTQWYDSDQDGYGENALGNTPDSCPNQPGTSVVRATFNNTNETYYGCEDRDNDGYDDYSDPCPDNYGNSWVDQLGCYDSDGDGISNINDPDSEVATSDSFDWDGDGYLDHATNSSQNTDDFPYDSSQWTDSDGDGFGDNPSGTNADQFPNDITQWQDSDDDGYGDNHDQGATTPDDCIYQSGNSTLDRRGCIDSDGDGHSDASSSWLANPFGLADSHPYDSEQYEDMDNDGCGDNYVWVLDEETGLRIESGDAFANDASQCYDRDGDGYGDNPFGLQADGFPDNSEEHLDADGDGYGDNNDDFPLDGSQWLDNDDDGYGDNQNGRDADQFPNDATQWKDSDNDGYGDDKNQEGGDQFPDDSYQWADSDGDGYGDEPVGALADAFPDDPKQWRDWDSDTCGDNHEFEGGDHFPQDATQCADSDGDGYGDNQFGNNPDAFPNDGTQWADADEDGLGDNPIGENPDTCNDGETQEIRLCSDDRDNDGWDDDDDQFPDESTQWVDDDDDGKGDNCNGRNGDCNPNDRDNDGYEDPANAKYDSDGFIILSSLSPGEDAFPEDSSEWADFDGDRVGDNSDQDNDNDGVADTEEMYAGTDPFNSAEKPFEGINIIGLQLGSWDLATILVGGPSALYLCFAVMSRNGRTARFEDMIYEANSEEDLEEISRKYELALQMRMIGPHQGLRLERIRSKQENILEYGEVEPNDEESEGKDPVSLDDSVDLQVEQDTSAQDHDGEDVEVEETEDKN